MAGLVCSVRHAMTAFAVFADTKSVVSSTIFQHERTLVIGRRSLLVEYLWLAGIPVLKPTCSSCAEPLPRDPQAPPAAAGLVQLLTYEGGLLPPPTAGLSQGLRIDDMRVALLAHPPVVPRLAALVSHPGANAKIFVFC